jgi:hypothetical protein
MHTYALHDLKYVDTCSLEHLIPSSWALIWSWSPVCCYNSLHSSGFPLVVGTLLRGPASIQPQAHYWGRHWCWPIRPGSQSGFQFIPKVFDGFEVRALCMPVKFFHTVLDKPFLYGPCFIHGVIVMLKHESAFPKLLPQSWKHRIV